MSREIGAEGYFECSARTGEGVQEVFNYAARAALLSPEKKWKTRKCLVL
jgi:Ras family protein A